MIVFKIGGQTAFQSVPWVEADSRQLELTIDEPAPAIHLEKETNGQDVVLISGCSREEDLLGDILEDEEHSEWEAKDDPKLMMFLGFDGPHIHASMDNFPRFEGQSRPIFCTPTQENIGWRLDVLLKDLMEEREYFRRQNAENRRTNEKAN